MKVYVLMRFERCQMDKQYGDHGCYYEEDLKIINIYVNKETAERVAKEKNEKFGNEEYETEVEYFVRCWSVNEE